MPGGLARLADPADGAVQHSPYGVAACVAFKYSALLRLALRAAACAAFKYSVLRTSRLRGRRVRGAQFGQTAKLVGFLPT